MSREVAHERVIHLVQNTRHANPRFADGYALRLLARPMARIMVAHEVMDACRPHLNRESSSTTIVEAHDWNYFHRPRSGDSGDVLRVAYTTWKSDLGVKVQRAMEQPFRFRSIRRTASWAEVRDLLHWCDVFVCCPGPEEGFYLPGLEAMAAGAIVLTPDVGGNRAYARFGDNCVQVPFEDVETTVSALHEVHGWPADRVHAMRERAYDTLSAHTLDRERDSFGQVLVDLGGRCERARMGS
jgi:glycosyltransferase involved in cell wall biosynthesis